MLYREIIAVCTENAFLDSPNSFSSGETDYSPIIPVMLACVVGLALDFGILRH